jgi:hypothetical protein
MSVIQLNEPLNQPVFQDEGLFWPCLLGPVVGMRAFDDVKIRTKLFLGLVWDRRMDGMTDVERT